MARGRSPDLIKLRNEKLVERFFHHSEVQRTRFDDVLRILMFDEFFIDERTILRILRDNSERLNEMKSKQREQQREQFEKRQLKIAFDEKTTPPLQWGKGRGQLQR